MWWVFSEIYRKGPTVTWQIYLIITFFIISSVGQGYFTITRLTSLSFIKSFFQKESPFQNISQLITSTHNIVFLDSKVIEEIQSKLSTVSTELSTLKSATSGGYEQLYTLIMRGAVIKIDELIETRYAEKQTELKKREDLILDLAKKIEDYGKTILKAK